MSSYFGDISKLTDELTEQASKVPRDRRGAGLPDAAAAHLLRGRPHGGERRAAAGAAALRAAERERGLDGRRRDAARRALEGFE